MVVTLSLVLVSGVVLALLVHHRKVAVGGATVAVLFGFLLASTDAGPDISDSLQSIADNISDR
ncbi:hypothetical protein [Streptomyces alboflavus]|uniref:hypothetical protein n=1 Tax=Streptomyces alboflavus TaxID=67267 RepID=UPI0004BFC971|nr:hypothetical protein [Streptomyces alboflavus]